jgi:hypothetical protein
MLSGGARVMVIAAGDKGHMEPSMQKKKAKYEKKRPINMRKMRLRLTKDDTELRVTIRHIQWHCRFRTGAHIFSEIAVNIVAIAKREGD